MRYICSMIWNLSEWSGIGLGRFAPRVFAIMIGATDYEKVSKKPNPEE